MAALSIFARSGRRGQFFFSPENTPLPEECSDEASGAANVETASWKTNRRALVPFPEGPASGSLCWFLNCVERDNTYRFEAGSLFRPAPELGRGCFRFNLIPCDVDGLAKLQLKSSETETAKSGGSAQDLERERAEYCPCGLSRRCANVFCEERAWVRAAVITDGPSHAEDLCLAAGARLGVLQRFSRDLSEFLEACARSPRDVPQFLMFETLWGESRKLEVSRAAAHSHRQVPFRSPPKNGGNWTSALVAILNSGAIDDEVPCGTFRVATREHISTIIEYVSRALQPRRRDFPLCVVFAGHGSDGEFELEDEASLDVERVVQQICEKLAPHIFHVHFGSCNVLESAWPFGKRLGPPVEGYDTSGESGDSSEGTEEEPDYSSELSVSLDSAGQPQPELPTSPLVSVTGFSREVDWTMSAAVESAFVSMLAQGWEPVAAYKKCCGFLQRAVEETGFVCVLESDKD